MLNAAPARSNGPGARRPRLLVVDDQPLNVQVLYQAFAADHQVLMATSGAQALDLCASQHPDLILLDIVMPGMDGFEVCRRLKANPATRDTPVIFVTAQADVAAETRGLALGAVDFISKPVNPAIVRARVRTHLTLKAQADVLRQWACIDGLTGVCNRRHFDERLAAEWARAARGRTAIGVVLVDVDFFKRINDRYGHQAGDDCLRAVAATLQESLRRPADLVARYGGDEFVCMLPDTGLDGAIGLARHLGRQVFERGIERAGAPAEPAVTVSVGVCGTDDAALGSVAALLAGADAQLYRAKSGGRNRTCGAALAVAAGCGDAPRDAARMAMEVP